MPWLRSQVVHKIYDLYLQDIPIAQSPLRPHRHWPIASYPEVAAQLIVVIS